MMVYSFVQLSENQWCRNKHQSNLFKTMLEWVWNANHYKIHYEM